jgi:outer membrane protein TolC
LAVAFWLFAFSHTNAQSITIEECYQLAKENYPAIKKLDLISKTEEFNIQNANKRYLPQVSFSGQATYQSQTVDFGDALGSLPVNTAFPGLSKDQYKVLGEVDQLLYDAGNTKNQKELIKTKSALQEQNIEANLYAIKQRINTIYFSILLVDAQLKQNEINKASLLSQVQKAEAALVNGVAFRSNVDELKAEIINIEMAGTEYKFNRLGYLKMLSLFIGKDIDSAAQLKLPESQPIDARINRPELKALDLQKAIYDVQEKQLKLSYLPTVNAFLQGAYGRPTLNIIQNKFGPWYLAGVRFNWNLGSLYTLSNNKSILNLDRKSLEADKETFLLNSKIDLTQQDAQVNKFEELLDRDNEVIALRASITKSADAQLSNGVITTHEYIQKLNAENLARQTKILHEIELLRAQYNQQFISGN